MAAYIPCDDCFRLWVKYGVAVREAREVGKRPRDPKAPIVPEAVENALKAIKQHGAISHGQS